MRAILRPHCSQTAESTSGGRLHLPQCKHNRLTLTIFAHPMLSKQNTADTYTYTYICYMNLKWNKKTKLKVNFLYNFTSFFATSHGKGACDGLGGLLKRWDARASLQWTYEGQILDALSFYNWAIENIKNINFF